MEAGIQPERPLDATSFSRVSRWAKRTLLGTPVVCALGGHEPRRRVAVFSAFPRDRAGREPQSLRHTKHLRCRCGRKSVPLAE